MERKRDKLQDAHAEGMPAHTAADGSVRSSRTHALRSCQHKQLQISALINAQALLAAPPHLAVQVLQPLGSVQG